MVLRSVLSKLISIFVDNMRLMHTIFWYCYSRYSGSLLIRDECRPSSDGSTTTKTSSNAARVPAMRRRKGYWSTHNLLGAILTYAHSTPWCFLYVTFSILTSTRTDVDPKLFLDTRCSYFSLILCNSKIFVNLKHWLCLAHEFVLRKIHGSDAEQFQNGITFLVQCP